MTAYRAACNCGELEIVCEGEPVRISICHCLECQRRTGAVFSSQAWFSRQQTTSISGNSTQFTRRSDAGRSATFRFCPRCGSTVYWQAKAFPAHDQFRSQEPECFAVAGQLSCHYVAREEDVYAYRQ